MHVRYSTTRLLLGLLFLALAPFQVAHAGFDNGQWSTGYTVDWKTGVTSTSSQWNPGGSPSSGNTKWGVSGGLPSASSVGHLPVGKSYIDVDARVVPDRAKLGAAFGRFARKFGPLANAYALMELAQELNYIFNPDGTVQKQDPSICTVAPCYAYYTTTNQTAPFPRYSSVPAACSAFYARMAVLVPGANPWVYTGYSGNTCQGTANGSLYYVTALSESAAPAASNLVPSSYTQFEGDIAAKTNWPANSKLPAAMRELADSGEPIEAPAPTVSGPASKVGPTSTTTNPDGTTVTRSETYNVTYAGNTINYTTTIVTNNNGQITTEVKQSEPPPDVCEKHPNTVGCVSLDTPVSDTLQKKTHAVTVTAVVFSSSSVCPAPLSFTVRGASYGVSYQPLCDRLALLKTLFLALAGVLAAFIVADSFRVT